MASAGVVGLLGPISGRLSDRLDRRRLMVASEVAGAIGWAAVLLADAPITLVLAALLATAANAPFRSASSASVPNLVAAEHLSWANSAIATATNAAMVVGPLLGGAVIGAVGARAVFGLNAVTFLVSALMIARMTGDFAEARPTVGQPTPTSWRELLRDHRRAGLYAVTALSFGAFGITLVADLPLVDEFGGGSIGYALLTTLWGTGAVVGSMAMGRLPAGRERLALIGGTAAMAVSIGSISVMPNLASTIAVGTIGGLGSGIAFAPWFSLLQRATADAQRGTAFAIAETLEQSSFIAGMVLAGAVVGLLGPQATYLLPGALLLAATVVAVRLDRRWDRSPAPCPIARSLGAAVPG